MSTIPEILLDLRAAEDAFLREYRFLPRLKPPTIRLLRLIAEHHAQTGCSPTYRELLREGSYSSLSVVAWHTGRLMRKGLVTNEPGKARSLRLTAEGEKYLRLIQSNNLFQDSNSGVGTGTSS